MFYDLTWKRISFANKIYRILDTRWEVCQSSIRYPVYCKCKCKRKWPVTGDQWECRNPVTGHQSPANVFHFVPTPKKKSSEKFLINRLTHASRDGENRSAQPEFRQENDRLQIEALTRVSPAGQGLQKHLRRMLGNGTVISVNQHAAESPQVSLRLPPLSPSVKWLAIS